MLRTFAANDLFSKPHHRVLVGSRRSGRLDTDTVTELSCTSNCVSKQSLYLHIPDPQNIRIHLASCLWQPRRPRTNICFVLWFWILQTAPLKKNPPKEQKSVSSLAFTSLWGLLLAILPKRKIKGNLYRLPACSDLTCLTKEYPRH